MWTGENKTKTISVDANLFENGAKQLRFRLKTGQCGRPLLDFLTYDEPRLFTFFSVFSISVEGIWILILSGSIFFTLCSLFLFVSCRRGTKPKSIQGHQNPSDDDKSPPLHGGKSLSRR